MNQAAAEGVQLLAERAAVAGKYPQYYLGSTTDAGLNLFVPTPGSMATTNWGPSDE